MRVIIADDHPAVRRGLKSILGADPEISVVGEARDGEGALWLAREVEFDIAILDYVMPGPSGLELLAKMKREHPTRPLIVLSMHDQDLYAAPAIEAGAAAFLSKECIAEELTRTIRRVARGKAGDRSGEGDGEPEAAEARLHESLSDAEFRVMWMLASGKSIDRIAEDMCVAEAAVAEHRSRILAKLQLADDAELVRYAAANRLVE